MENLKVCPFAAANPQQKNSDCLGESCACYVKIQKPCLMQTDECEIEIFYRYYGCGLITQVPWELVKRKDPKNSGPKPVN